MRPPCHPLVSCAHTVALVLSAACVVQAAVAQGPTFGVPPSEGGPPHRYDTAIAYDPARGQTVLYGGTPSFGDTWEWDGVAWVQRAPATNPGPGSSNFDSTYKLAYMPGVGVVHAGEYWTWTWNGVDWNLASATSTLDYSNPGVAYHAGINPGLLLFGRPNYAGVPFNETWLFDGATWTLRSATGPTPRQRPAVAYTPVTQSTYAVGGRYHVGAPQNEMWRWNGTTWNLVTNLGTPPWPLGPAHGMAWDADRGAFVVVDTFNTHFATPLAETPNVVTWSSVANPAGMTPSWASCAFDSARRRVVFFGTTWSGPTMFRELPQGTTNWIDLGAPSPEPSARSYFDMTFDPNEGTILFGGWNGSQPLADTWSFDGHRWTNRGTNGAPPRLGTALCHFASVGGTVMFGGGTFTGTYMRDLRLWNGSYWQPVQTGFRPKPPARMCHDMVYDSGNDRVVLFGGWNNASFGDTWALSTSWWSGPEWEQVGWAGGPSPPARNSHRMAYDEQRGCVVLFGGCSSSGDFLGDTWELVGSTWTQVFPPQSPSPRWHHVMDYDPLRGVVVLIGGYSDFTFNDDVWEYDGITWTQRTPTSTKPSGREGAGFTWDERVQRFVIRGGYSWGTGLHADTWFYQSQ